MHLSYVLESIFVETLIVDHPISDAIRFIRLFNQVLALFFNDKGNSFMQKISKEVLAS